MKLRTRCALAAIGLSAATPSIAADMTPGQYEYTLKMNMPGGPSMPAQTVQRCLSKQDVSGTKAFEMPAGPNSDCQIKDLTRSGGQFAYRVACTRPEKIDSSVKGTHTATGMTMEMTMAMPGAPSPITQSITARRLGDCK